MHVFSFVTIHVVNFYIGILGRGTYCLNYDFFQQKVRKIPVDCKLVGMYKAFHEDTLCMHIQWRNDSKIKYM